LLRLASPGDDGDAAAAFEHGVLNLVEAFQTLNAFATE
jgi:hypothetical protein